MSQLLECLLSFVCKCIQRFNRHCVRFDPRFICKSLRFEFRSWNKIHEEFLLFINIGRVRAKMPLAKSVEEVMNFRVKLLEITFILSNKDFEMTRDLLFLIFVSNKDDSLSNHSYLLAMFSFKINFKLPIM